jgi:environmental stress-induced protein Ves
MDRQSAGIAGKRDMRILRAGERMAVPWKNGGGTTSEVAVYPEGAGFDDFGWRISIADIARGGPFSLFPGIDRTLILLKGQVTLSIEGRSAVTLTPDSEPLDFPGDVATSAELVGTARDLNVMTRRGTFTARTAKTHGRNIDLSLSHAADARFCAPLAATTASYGTDVIALEPGDILRPDRGETGLLAFSEGTLFLWIEIWPGNPRK